MARTLNQDRFDALVASLKDVQTQKRLANQPQMLTNEHIKQMLSLT